MATWVRTGTSTPTEPDSNGVGLVGDVTLSNATAPGDFDPAGVNSVRIQWTFRISAGLSDDSWSENTSAELDSGGSVLASVGSGSATRSASGDYPQDLTDSTIGTGFSTGQWEAAVVQPPSGTWATINKNKGWDGTTASIVNVTVTIDYTPGAAPPNSGSASGSVTVSGSATGTAPVVPMSNGSATGSVTVSGSASGTTPAVLPNNGTAAGNVAVAGSAAGSIVASGTPGALMWNLTALTAEDASFDGTEVVSEQPSPVDMTWQVSTEWNKGWWEWGDAQDPVFDPIVTRNYNWYPGGNGATTSAGRTLFRSSGGWLLAKQDRDGQDGTDLYNALIGRSGIMKNTRTGELMVFPGPLGVNESFDTVDSTWYDEGTYGGYNVETWQTNDIIEVSAVSADPWQLWFQFGARHSTWKVGPRLASPELSGVNEWGTAAFMLSVCPTWAVDGAPYVVLPQSSRLTGAYITMTDVNDQYNTWTGVPTSDGYSTSRYFIQGANWPSYAKFPQGTRVKVEFAGVDGLTRSFLNTNSTTDYATTDGYWRQWSTTESRLNPNDANGEPVRFANPMVLRHSSTPLGDFDFGYRSFYWFTGNTWYQARSGTLPYDAAGGQLAEGESFTVTPLGNPFLSSSWAYAYIGGATPDVERKGRGVVIGHSTDYLRFNLYEDANGRPSDYVPSEFTSGSTLKLEWEGGSALVTISGASQVGSTWQVRFHQDLSGLIPFHSTAGWLRVTKPSYITKALELGATFLQVGGFDIYSGLALPSGTDPGVSINGIDAWTGSIEMDIGDQMAAGGNWSLCVIWRRVDSSTGNGAFWATRTGGSTSNVANESTLLWTSATADIDTYHRVRHGSLFMNQTAAFVPQQWGQDWTFGGFRANGATTEVTSRLLSSDGTFNNHTRTRASNPGTLSKVLVQDGAYVEYAGFAIFPNVELSDADFDDLYSFLPNVGQGNL